MEKVYQKLFWVHLFGYPHCSNGTKIHLDVELVNNQFVLLHLSSAWSTRFCHRLCHKCDVTCLRNLNVAEGKTEAKNWRYKLIN